MRTKNTTTDLTGALDRLGALIATLIDEDTPAKPPKPQVNPEKARKANRELAAWLRENGITPNGAAWAEAKAGERNIHTLRALQTGVPTPGPDTKPDTEPATGKNPKRVAAGKRNVTDRPRVNGRFVPKNKPTEPDTEAEPDTEPVTKAGRLAAKRHAATQRDQAEREKAAARQRKINALTGIGLTDDQINVALTEAGL